jgi:hypothetical protein|tara:strand:+ start:1443 stop:1883 length:441 start_codon:yes stop_codon:yes gene_type:complete
MKILLLTSIFLGSFLNAADLRLEWQDNSNNEDGFEIWRRVNEGEWLLIGATNTDVATFVDGVIPIGSVLSYRVRAWNQFGESGYTNIVSVGTYPPAAPSNASGVVVPSNSVSLEYHETEVGPEAPRRSVSVRTYRDKNGRLVLSKS